MTSLELRSVRKGFGSRCVIYDASCTFHAGVHLIDGDNGAGKTTLLQLLVGLCEPTAGAVLLDGRDIFRHRNSGRRKIAFVAAEPKFFEGVSVKFAVQLYAALCGEKRRGDPFMHFDPFGLERFAGSLFGDLSLGWRKRTLLHMAFASNASILILDEPTIGLDPAAIQILSDCIRDRTHEKMTVLTCHDVRGLSLEVFQRHVLQWSSLGSVLSHP